MQDGGTLSNDFFQNEGVGISKGLRQGQQFGNIASSAASVIPGWGPLISAGIQFGQGIGNMTRDEFGVSKSKAASVIANTFDPATIFQSIKDVGKRGGLASLVTRGLVESPAQRAAEKAKSAFQYRTMQQGIEANDVTGRMIKSSLGTYAAPAYGKKGMKFKSKFARND